MARVLLLLASVSLAACAVPEPRGAARATEHYEVRTDEPSPVFAERVAASAEQAHAALARAFGAAPDDAFPVVVYRQRVAFDSELSAPLRGRGFVGECGDRFALVFWPDDVHGKDTLAHELVHRFNSSLIPEIPYWVDEGLAKALAPKRDQGDWLGALARLGDDELRACFRSLGALPEGGDYALRCLVAAAVVRCALDTEGFADARGLRGWKPDVEAFLHWLRARRRGGAPGRFAPVWAEPER